MDHVDSTKGICGNELGVQQQPHGEADVPALLKLHESQSSGGVTAREHVGGSVCVDDECV